MPRQAPAIVVRASYPWDDWTEMLQELPEGEALYFDKSDFPTSSPEAFRNTAKRAFTDRGLEVEVAVRGREVMVALA